MTMAHRQPLGLQLTPVRYIVFQHFPLCPNFGTFPPGQRSLAVVVRHV
jgi:hypothetical protein